MQQAKIDRTAFPHVPSAWTTKDQPKLTGAAQHPLPPSRRNSSGNLTMTNSTTTKMKKPSICSQAPIGQDCCCCKRCAVGGCDLQVLPCKCCMHAVGASELTRENEHDANICKFVSHFDFCEQINFFCWSIMSSSFATCRDVAPSPKRTP